jgi:hypothetical protein
MCSSSFAPLFCHDPPVDGLATVPALLAANTIEKSKAWSVAASGSSRSGS